MNKGELVANVSERAGLHKADTEKAIDAVFKVITEAVRLGDKVRLVGFGTFLSSDRRASQGRNPSTGEKIEIPAQRVPRFRAGKQLRDAMG